MTGAESKPQDTPKSVYVYWGSMYFITVATLYLWGYWSEFDINILEYVDLTDIAKTAAYPVASTFISILLGVILGEALPLHKELPYDGGRNTRTGRALHRLAPILKVIYAVSILLLFSLGPPQKWLVFPFLIAFPISFVLTERGFLADAISSINTRSIGHAASVRIRIRPTQGTLHTKWDRIHLCCELN